MPPGIIPYAAAAAAGLGLAVLLLKRRHQGLPSATETTTDEQIEADEEVATHQLSTGKEKSTLPLGPHQPPDPLPQPINEQGRDIFITYGRGEATRFVERLAQVSPTLITDLSILSNLHPHHLGRAGPRRAWVHCFRRHWS